MKIDEVYSFIECLENTIKYLKQSDESFYTKKNPEDVIKLFNKTISRLKKNKSINKSKLSFEFAPTSSIQEIAIDNGWGNEYLKLSEDFDALITLI